MPIDGSGTVRERGGLFLVPCLPHRGEPMGWDNRQNEQGGAGGGQNWLGVDVPGLELPPYYAQRVDTIRPATGISVRRRASQSETEAQTERLFRDFKLGLVTLVVVALLLVAYFWDGEPERLANTTLEDDAVLSIRQERVGSV